jgi:hypothetical protein
LIIVLDNDVNGMRFVQRFSILAIFSFGVDFQHITLFQKADTFPQKKLFQATIRIALMKKSGKVG